MSGPRTGEDYQAFKDRLLDMLAEEDKLPGPAHRNLDEVIDDHLFQRPADADWLHHAVVDFCEAGIVQLEGHDLLPNPGEPVCYALTLEGLNRAGALK